MYGMRIYTKPASTGLVDMPVRTHVAFLRPLNTAPHPHRHACHQTLRDSNVGSVISQ